MATKLKNLKVRKVDFVDAGANPDAYIKMFKSREKGCKEQDNEKGTANIWKRLLGFIGKAAGMGQEEIDSAIEEIQKSDSVSFNEKLNEAKNRKIADEIWDMCYAMQSSLCSILNDEELDSTKAAAAMQESLDEFHTVVQDAISNWAIGESANIVRKNDDISEADVELMKSAVERLNESIVKASGAVQKEHEKTENLKGEGEEMKIDKSKLTEAEKAFLDSIEKRYGTEESAGQPEGSTPASQQPAVQIMAEPNIAKSVTESQASIVPTQQEDEGQSDIYKGLHPAVKAELESLKKFRQDTEEKELVEVAKKYVMIGKKEEELVPLFKSLKAAGGTAYNDMIAVLDQTVSMVEKSGMFSEIGKSGHGSSENSAETKIIGIAKSLMEKDSSLSYPEALAKAWEDNPNLLNEYEEEAGF